MQPRVPEAGAGAWLSRPQPRGRMAGDAASVGAEPSPPRTVTPGSCGPEIGRPSAGAFVPTSGSHPSAPPLRGGTPHTGPTAVRHSAAPAEPRTAQPLCTLPQPRHPSSGPSRVPAVPHARHPRHQARNVLFLLPETFLPPQVELCLCFLPTLFSGLC